MIEAVRQEKDTYLANFAELERRLADRDPEWLRQMRKKAILRVAEYGFPTARDEDWKYTNLSPLSRIPFRLAGRPVEAPLKLADHPALSLPGARLVFVNGEYDARRSDLTGLPEGTRIQNLSCLISQGEDGQNALSPHLSRYADVEDNVFTALNLAFLREGAFVSIPSGVVVEAPIHLVYLSEVEEAPFVAHPRNLLLVGRGSQAQFVESYVGQEGAQYFTNPVTELVLEAGSVVEHYRVQLEGQSAFHVGALQTHQRRDSSLTLHAFDLGGLLVRNNLTVTLDGEGAHALLHGLYLGSGERLIDNHTRIEHLKAHCDSRELYKGILSDSSRAVFHGRITVSPGAQKTDAKQTNKNLLLSNQALVNTKPQLEIYADDVKCTHGATIGRLDDEALFYLRSRGIGKREATNLLIFAFANEIIGAMKIEPLRDRLDQLVHDWLPRLELKRGGTVNA
jgi:Fe-S cluster assembly protein SufD